MAQWQDEVEEGLSGGADQNPYVTRDGAVSAIAHAGYRGSPATLLGTQPATTTAVGGITDTATEYAGTGSKLHSFRNAGVEKAYIDKDGDLHHGLVWDDIQGPVATAGGISAVTSELFGDTDFPAVFMRHDQDDQLFWTFQLPHRWDASTSVKMHVHIVPMSDPLSAQVVRFDGAYAWAHYGTAVPLQANWTAIPAVSHTVNPGDILKPGIVPLATIPPGDGAKESDILMVKVRRPGSSDSADTYTTGKAIVAGTTAAANVCILSADLHFQASKLGTATEIPT